MSGLREERRLHRMRSSWADLEPTAFDVEVAYQRNLRRARRVPLREIAAFGLLGAALGAAAAMSVDFSHERGLSVSPEPVAVEQTPIAAPPPQSASRQVEESPPPVRPQPVPPATRHQKRSAPTPTPVSAPAPVEEHDPRLGSARRWLSLERRGDGGAVTVGLDQNP